MSALSKILLYSHDTYGLGHLRRNLAIARHLLITLPGVRVVLATGSIVADRFDKPEALQLVELPPVIKTGVDQYSAMEPALPLSLVRRARSAVLSDVVSRWQPDIFLVDHSPQGMKGELLPVFETLEKKSPTTKVVLGLRDILDDPSRVRNVWSAEGVYETLHSIYDRILVYGRPEVSDVVNAYGLSDFIKSKLSYCGYVASAPPSHPVLPLGISAKQPYILGTIGGGGDGSDVLKATASAAAKLGLVPVLACGPLMSPSDREAVDKAAKLVPNAIVVDMFEDLAAIAMGASCIVTRGGYNSLCELVPLGVPTVVVPRVWPRQEQLLRANAFAVRGLVNVLEVDPGELATQLPQAITQAIEQSVSTTSCHQALDLGGLSELTAALLEVAKAGRQDRYTDALEGSSLVGAWQ